MAQIKLSPEKLETSATKYTQGSEEFLIVLLNLERKQEVIRSKRKMNNSIIK